MQTFYSNGKLLITGEYVVLDGALSLALPTKYGQSLIVESINDQKLVWKSFDEKEDVWLRFLLMRSLRVYQTLAMTFQIESFKF